MRSLPRDELEAWVRDELGLPAWRGRQVFRWLWRPGTVSFQQMTDLGKDLRAALAEAGEIRGFTAAGEQRSADGTRKFLWRLPDGARVESVYIPEERRRTLCVSSQVGCAMGCRFCRTARMGLVRQLTPGEIAGQVLAAVERLGDAPGPVRNLVFMGMGEPLANLPALARAIRILADDLGLNFSTRRITVSTCGLPRQMLELGRSLDVGLAVSLHAPDDELRSRLMPVNRRHPLAELLEACRRYPLPRRRRITFEYLLLAGVNDAPAHARRLADLLRGLRAKVNLIPFNECPGIPFRRPSDHRVEAFRQVLLEAGLNATVRRSRGTDIAAACGQLYAEDQRTADGREKDAAAA
nr:23S rRNA (adenine(2503)-C(2))-methyltransferase RlmN [Dissulfurirhabdus thermomarina]